MISELAVVLLWRTTMAENQVLSRDLNDLARVNDLIIATQRSEERVRSYLQTANAGELSEAENASRLAESLLEELHAVLPSNEQPLLLDLERARTEAFHAAEAPIALRLGGASSPAVEEVRRLFNTQQGVRRAFILVAASVLMGGAFLPGAGHGDRLS